MEGGVGNTETAGAAGGGGATGNSRWNPTKEQISILENFYQQGIRTPSADQIYQITTRLKAYGTIEGKNVFYWFQNHKARQRQKQKQENLAYINRHLHRTKPVYPPPPPPPCSSVCGPYFVPQGDHHLGFYPQCPKVLLPGGSMKRRGRPAGGKMVKSIFYGGNVCDRMVHQDYNTLVIPETENSGGTLGKGGSGSCSNDNNTNHHEALPLFPMHPIGACEGKSTPLMDSQGGPSSSETAAAGVDRESTEGSSERRLFDFFSCQASSESD